MELAQRRVVGRLIRSGLIMLAVVLGASWFLHRLPHSGKIRVHREVVTDEALGPGDFRIYNIDSSVDVVLKGNQILAGLSPQMVAKVRRDMERSSAKDTGGLAGLIASTVKQTVASTIGTHVVYPIDEIRDVRYEDGRIVLEKSKGGETRLFGDARVNGKESGKTFRAEDVQRLRDAVRARKGAFGAT